MDSNQSGAVGGIIWGPFLGSWTHLGASRGLRSQKWGPYLAIFGPSLTPPANPVKFFWSKMACTGVPHIVLHVSCRTRTSGGCFWPSEVRFRGILALSRAWFCNGQKQKCKFLKKGSLPNFQILCGDLWGNFTKNGTNLRSGQFFSFLTLLGHCENNEIS